MADTARVAAAYYARRGSRWAERYTLLHPPYTAWHLGYAVIGAALAPRLDVVRLVGSVIVLFLAVGVAAHALDELSGRPLGTTIPDAELVAAATLALIAAALVAAWTLLGVGLPLLALGAIGLVLLLGYNLELAGGRLHTGWGFALGWGAYPVVAGYVAQTGRLTVVPVLAAFAAMAASLAQRELSMHARGLRRRARAVHCRLSTAGGDVELTRDDLLRPVELALRALSSAICLLGAAVALSHWL